MRALAFVALLAVACGGARSFPGAPSIQYDDQGSAHCPWQGFEQAIYAARDVLSAEFPGDSRILEFKIDVWGANDHMDDGHACFDSQIYGELAGCTDRTCDNPLSIFDRDLCAWFVEVRQILANRSGPEHFPIFSGALLDVSASALFYEIGGRYVPCRREMPECAEPLGDAASFPRNQARINAIQARYETLIGN